MFVIVLAWNAFELSADCLRSLRQVTYGDMRCVVVDNGSEDGTAEKVRQAFPDIHVIRNTHNLGFSAGNNVGIRYALEQGADYILLLNNDTIVAPDFLEPLVSYCEAHTDVGMVCPKIAFQTLPGELWAVGSHIHLTAWRRLVPTRGRRSLTAMLFELRGHHEVDRGQLDFIAEVDGAPGCACMVSRAAIERVGLLDEEFYLVHEDSDWSMRVRRAGYRIAAIPASRIQHRVTASSGSSRSATIVYYATRNALLFVRKHAPLPIRCWLYLLSTLAFLTDGALFPMRGKASVTRHARVRAFADFWAGRLGRQSLEG